MEPVWALPQGEGTAFVDPVVLRYHRDGVTEGHYTLRWEFTSLPARLHEDVVVREDTQERLWVPAGPVEKRVAVSPSNEVRIRIRGVSNNRMEAER